VSEVPLHQHWHDVYVRRWLILLTAAAAVVVALAFSRAVTPIFEAKTTFYLAATAPTPSFVGPTEAPAPLYPVPEEKAAALDIGILRGREVRTALAERFDLPYSEIEQRVDYNVSGEFMIDVFARNPDPELAAAISNAVPEIYEEFHERSMRARAGNIARVLEQRLEDLEAREEEVRAALRALREESLSTADSAALARIEAEREAAQTEMHGLETQIAQTTARLGSLEASLSDEDLIYAEARTVDTTSSLDRMLERVLDLRVDLAAVTDGPNSPRRLAIEQQISQIEDAMAREQERLAEASAKPQGTLYEELRMEIATTEALLAGLAQARDSAASRLARAESRFAEVLGASDAHSEAMAELERIEAQTAATIENLEAARLQEANATPPLLVVERAVPPTRPAFPLSVLNAIAAALCGLVFGTYYALFIAQSERAAQVRRSRTAPMPAFTPQEIAEIRVLAREWERANAR
jgi:uncharacterized protein involved in exopolysaccharide biosynthesis